MRAIAFLSFTLLWSCADVRAQFGDHSAPKAEFVEFQRQSSLFVEWEEPVRTIVTEQVLSAVTPYLGLTDADDVRYGDKWPPGYAAWVPRLKARGSLYGRFGDYYEPSVITPVYGHGFASCYVEQYQPGVYSYDGGPTCYEASHAFGGQYDPVEVTFKSEPIDVFNEISETTINATGVSWPDNVSAPIADYRGVGALWKMVWWCPGWPLELGEVRGCRPWAEAWKDKELMRCYGYKRYPGEDQLTTVEVDCPDHHEPLTSFEVEFFDPISEPPISMPHARGFR